MYDWPLCYQRRKVYDWPISHSVVNRKVSFFRAYAFPVWHLSLTGQLQDLAVPVWSSFDSTRNRFRVGDEVVTRKSGALLE